MANERSEVREVEALASQIYAMSNGLFEGDAADEAVRIAQGLEPWLREHDRKALSQAQAECDMWKGRHDAAVAQCRYLHQEGLSREQWHLKHCGAMDDLVRWLVEVLHYPFDMQFDPPPPVDHRKVAEHWRVWDHWDDVSAEDALSGVLEEAGLEDSTGDSAADEVSETNSETDNAEGTDE